MLNQREEGTGSLSMSMLFMFIDSYLLPTLSNLLDADALDALRTTDRWMWGQIPLRRTWYQRVRERLRIAHTPTMPFAFGGGDEEGNPPIYPCAHHDCRRNVLCCVDMRFDPPLAYRTSIPYCATHMREHYADLLRWIHEC